MSRRFYTDVLGKMCAKDVEAPHTWKLHSYPWGKIVAATEKDNTLRITVECPLTGRMAEMWLLHVILNPGQEYLDKLKEEATDAQYRAAGKERPR